MANVENTDRLANRNFSTPHGSSAGVGMSGDTNERESNDMNLMTSIESPAYAQSDRGANKHPATWAQAKADFCSAASRLEKAGNAHADMEQEQFAFRSSAPSRTVTYMSKGFNVRHVSVTPHETTETLTPDNYGKPHTPEELAQLPEYIAFGEELAEWRAKRDQLGQDRGWDATEQEWQDAADAHLAALRQLIAFPVTSAGEIAEKIALSRADVRMDDDETNALLDAIASDLNRLG